MHTEHLYNLRWLWVAAGWLVAFAVTSLVALVFAAFGLTVADDETGNLGAVVAVALGFWVGGYFTGLRALRAPILHGIAIGLASLVAWLLLSLVTLLIEPPAWTALTPTLTAALLLVQMAAAVAGAWVGHRVALRGGLELRE
jgi:hypothetical protein